MNYRSDTIQNIRMERFLFLLRVSGTHGRSQADKSLAVSLGVGSSFSSEIAINLFISAEHTRCRCGGEYGVLVDRSEARARPRERERPVGYTPCRWSIVRCFQTFFFLFSGSREQPRAVFVGHTPPGEYEPPWSARANKTITHASHKKKKLQAGVGRFIAANGKICTSLTIGSRCICIYLIYFLSSSFFGPSLHYRLRH